jgi:uncharacterized protein (TIGR03435 family)
MLEVLAAISRLEIWRSSTAVGGNSMISRKLFVLSAATLLTVSVADAMPTTPTRLTFEVASINSSRPSAGPIYTIKPMPGGNGYTVQNSPFKLMMSLMYKVPMRQIVGGPDWINTDRFDIEARADHPSSVDDLHSMFQNLLADRFNLRFHKEVKEGPVYALTVDKSGLKMKADGTGQALGIPIVPKAGGGFTGTRVPMQYLSWWLGQQLQNDGRPVVDQTGLSQSYDFTLSFAPQLPPNVSRDSLPREIQDLPSIFEAVQQQLGLKLEPQRGPVEYYIIDNVEKPSPN